MSDILKKWCILLSVIIAVYSCREGKETAGKIVIIATNDMHAQIAAFPRLATLIQEKRAEGAEVVIVDAGDRFSGNPYVDHVPEKGKPMIDLMNKIEYDVGTLGNHDFDYGQKVLKKRLQEANFEVICANIVSEESELGAVAPYKMVEKGGLKLCFFGLIQTGSNHIPATNPANLENISFRYYKDVVPEYKKLAKECDVMIGLTHLGFANDSLLALVMPELSVIVGGHSHTVIHEPVRVNGVLIGQAGSNLHYAGVTTLTFEKKKLVDKSYTLVDLKKIDTPDQEVALLVEEINNYPEFKKVLGQAAVDMPHKENVASLMADAMADAVGADFAFCNKGGVRMNAIAKGNITREMVYKIEPFSNHIVTHDWTLAQIKEFILADYNRIADPDKRYINYFISAGKYEIIRDNEGNGTDIEFYDGQGNILKGNDKIYKIAFSNYTTSSNPYAKKGNPTSVFIADAIAAFLKQQGQVAYSEQRAFIK